MMMMTITDGEEKGGRGKTDQNFIRKNNDAKLTSRKQKLA